MAAAMQTLGFYRDGLDHRKESSWKEFFRDPSMWWDNRSSKRSPTQPDFKHRVTKEPLWLDSRENPPWVQDELVRHGFSAQKPSDMASDADASLLSLIWACCKNKDLSHGTRVHYELQKRGLSEKTYSDALVTMYAKCGELQKAQALLDSHNSYSIVPWNALISSYAREGQGQNALDCFEKMQHYGFPPNAVTYVCILKACALMGAIDKGKQIHDDILRQGMLEHNEVLGGALVDMYAKCGALPQARKALENLPSRNVVSWSALVAGYAQQGQGQQALECFEQMQREGVIPNAVTYVSILKACAVIGAIDKGKQIHDEILRQGLLEHSKVLGGALVDMYAKCGAFSQAQSALKKLPYCNAISWNALLTGYVEKGRNQEALESFEQLQRVGILPNAVTYVSILKACGATGAIDKGKQIHDEISRQGFLEHSVVLGGALVDMYAKCGALSQAQSVLESLPYRNVISWNALITGYAQKEQGQEALRCFEQMQHEGILPNAITYVCILKACAVIRAIDKGKEIHDEILRQELLEDDIVLGGALVDMYAKCGALMKAQNVLEKLPSRDVVSWNALIVGYAQKGQGQQALECYEQMQREGIPPDAVTYASILKACAVIGAVDKGKQIHDEISRQGLLERSIVLGGALVDMYAKCGALSEARAVLEKLPSRQVVSWSALISGYVEEGQGQQAIECFEQMLHEGILPDAVTYVSILKACAAIGAVDKGKQIDDEIARQGLLQHDMVLGSALVDMYAKCGALPQAQSVLEKLPSRDVVPWNALIAGYAHEGEGEQALKCFEQMQDEGIRPDIATLSCLLNLCSHLGLVEKGQKLFDDMGAVHGLKPDEYCFTCMVDLLGRTGHLVKAVEVIQKMPFSATSAIWLCLLGACLEWVDVNVGSLAFEQAVKLDKCDGAAYILMANLYASAGMPEKAKDIDAMRIKNKPWSQPISSSWIDSNDTVHEFWIGDKKHKDLQPENIKYKTAQVEYRPNWVLDASDVHPLCDHSEKLVLT
ncbi:hypothetical protein GOP47_0015052 [Adiantum capillus-veneris]|uniref:Pentatricopeptide repeat-containing protein n=1 Tax=Adiantum capillus-veneris TaxID=13818 RepID=A0A9D4UN80_ADICA|nr:hypothetical protein GOP47_0015052 [Adiantum capillus-veneris]